MTIERWVDPCSSPAAIGAWIDQLLDLRFAFARTPEIVDELDAELRLATRWRVERPRRKGCE